MLTKLFAVVAIAIAMGAIYGSYTQRSALHLGQEAQAAYWPRHGTRLSGHYHNSVWVPLPSRTVYGGFQGGGPGVGK
ncbi:hypothetical protein [Geitlerinema sp. PCC 7407]|uniref:hypothetical protein n=1 Tax=Geitlerinema sp. PCC 7407 TaxID=1173025 RepID=UPI00029F9BE1|nr:hypothetical protein [Geitlerinema sp. PCC 7407]AFY65390.1 hypothetical protein GEI7407_0892 [Geitlerinema sp. PCC 7407]